MQALVFILKRTAQAVFVVFAVSFLVALAIRLSGDPTDTLAGDSNASAEDRAMMREALGLDRPFLVQYGDFMGGLLSGDPGNSFFRGPIAPLLSKSLKATVILAFASLAVSLVIALPLGIYAARHRGSRMDQLIRILSLAGLSFPNFWLGLMLMLLFSVTLRWLPPSGYEGPSSVILPALTMGLILTASNLRIVRSAMLEVLSRPHIMVARAKGLSEGAVVYRHALRNAAITIVTYLGLQFGSLMGGVVIVELVFNWPGMGYLAFEAIGQRDYPVIQTVVTVFAAMIVAVNLLVDLTYTALDPRIRLE